MKAVTGKRVKSSALGLLKACVLICKIFSRSMQVATSSVLGVALNRSLFNCSFGYKISNKRSSRSVLEEAGLQLSCSIVWFNGSFSACERRPPVDLLLQCTDKFSSMLQLLLGSVSL